MAHENNHKLAVIVLAAGKGTRMRSRLPKVMHRLAGQPMIHHVLAVVSKLKPDQLVAVLAPDMNLVKESVHPEYPGCRYAIQQEQLGTGHAVRCGLEELSAFEGTVLVVYGDTPLITAESLFSLLSQQHEHQAAIALLGMRPHNPTGYGRLVMEQEPWVDYIVECKDATPEEKLIPWVWGGVMAFDAAFLKKHLAELQPSPVTGEYYLTKLVETATDHHQRCLMVEMPEIEAMGVNDRSQLAQAEFAMQQRLRVQAMMNGATLVDPQTVYFSADTHLSEDVVVQPNVIFGPKVRVERGVEIRAFSHIEGAMIEEGAVVGPFARLRPGSMVGRKAHVGNFVELKKTLLGDGAKANHLSYLGDTTVGAGANIGAGTITCNYDGVNKHHTNIGAGAFIGSNSALVAPVTVGEDSVIAAGSVITEDVPSGRLAIARSRQSVKVRRSDPKT